MEFPETRYARNGDVSIAYQVVGEGPFDLVFVPGFLSHVELAWSTPPFATILPRLASFARLIVFDRRNTGMSDRVPGQQMLETYMDDVRAVMDAAGSARASIVGVAAGAPMSLLLAATYPARTGALVLVGGYARWLWAPDYPWGRTEEQYRAQNDASNRVFASREAALDVARWLGNFDGEEAELLADYFRRSGSPGSFDSVHAMLAGIAVRHVLPATRVPTLLVHGTDDALAPIAGARYMAGRIPGARLVELPGQRHLPARTAVGVFLDELEAFLREAAAGPAPEEGSDRVLATVLFTDIVRSSERAVELGDRAWRELLSAHHELVRRQLVRFRGKEVDTAGDGFLASFDGPARAIRCAQAVVEGVRALGLEVRAGLHTGECELLDGKVAGIAVHTGARVASHAAPGEVLVSSTVKDLVAGSGLAFQDRGQHELKGLGEWRLFAVDSAS